MNWAVGFFWLAVLLAALAFFFADIAAFALRSPQSEGRRSWYVAHVAATLPVLLIAPLQFLTTLRIARPALHRRLGTAYLASAMLAGTAALYLGVTMASDGTQVPLVLFGLLWIAFSAIAWQAARRRAFDLHRRFVIRSTALASSFLLLHLMQLGEDRLFAFLDLQELRYATRGWLSLVLPLIVAEAWLDWWPAARHVFGKDASQIARQSLPDPVPEGWATAGVFERARKVRAPRNDGAG